MRCSSSIVNPIVIAELLLTSFYIAANKEYLMKRQIIFKCVNLALRQLYCLKLSFKLANISRGYEENLWAPFFR